MGVGVGVRLVCVQARVGIGTLYSLSAQREEEPARRPVQQAVACGARMQAALCLDTSRQPNDPQFLDVEASEVALLSQIWPGHLRRNSVDVGGVVDIVFLAFFEWLHFLLQRSLPLLHTRSFAGDRRDRLVLVWLHSLLHPDEDVRVQRLCGIHTLHVASHDASRIQKL